MLRRGSCSRSHRPDARAVHEVMPAKADACAEEHGENRTKTVGSQLQPGHGLRLGVHSPVTNGWVAPVGVEPTGPVVRTSPPALLRLSTTQAQRASHLREEHDAHCRGAATNRS